MVEAGEVLVRRRLRWTSNGLPVPLQLQVLEADFLDAAKSGAIGAGRLVQGIEFDPVGKRRAYWLHAEHPGDAYGALQNGLQSRPVPATEIAHVYEKQRTQARGVTWGAPVIRSLRDLDDYEVAELVRKKTEACVTAIVFGDDEAQQGIAPSVVDADGNCVEQFEPGLIAYARGGKDIRFNQPSATGGYSEYKRASLHATSAGFRVPYELLTGDLSQVNYSSIRAGLVEFLRQIDAVQWQLFIPMFCAPVWRWFTEAAWAAGQIPSPTVPVEWSPPKFEAVDPQKDAMANLLSIRSGPMTLAEVIARQGRNPAEESSGNWSPRQDSLNRILEKLRVDRRDLHQRRIAGLALAHGLRVVPRNFHVGLLGNADNFLVTELFGLTQLPTCFRLVHESGVCSDYGEYDPVWHFNNSTIVPLNRADIGANEALMCLPRLIQSPSQWCYPKKRLVHLGFRLIRQLLENL